MDHFIKKIEPSPNAIEGFLNDRKISCSMDRADISVLLSTYISERRERESKLLRRVHELEKRNSLLEDQLKMSSQRQEEFLSHLDHMERESHARRLKRSLDHSLHTTRMSGT